MGIEASAVSASKPDVIVSAAVKEPDPQPVKVEPAKAEPQAKAESKPVEEQQKPAPKPPLERHEAEKVASEVEAELNKNDQTVVRFNVSLVNNDGKDNGFKFQVVDKQTGKVIRQFPPEDILAVKDRLSATPPGTGALLDSHA